MVDVPFYCERCTITFGSGGIHIEGDIEELTLSGNQMSCPQCGRLGQQAIADGTYNVKNGRFEFVRTLADTIRSAKATRGDFDRLEAIIRSAQDDNLELDSIIQQIKDETPFESVAIFIQEQSKDRFTQVMTALAVIVAVIAWLYPRSPFTPQQLTPDQMQQVVVKTIQELRAEEQKACAVDVTETNAVNISEDERKHSDLPRDGK